MISRPAIFQWQQTEPGIILCAVRWYLRYSLSLRDVEELLEYPISMAITQRSGGGCSITALSWSSDCEGVSSGQTSRGVWTKPRSARRGRWCYLYRPIDSAGATIDFLLSAFRDADAARRRFRKRSAIDSILNL